MALPRRLKNLNLFVDANSWMGVVESITLPKFSRKFQKYRGGGMPGAVDIDMGLDDGALDTEFTINGTEGSLFSYLSTAKADGIQMRFLGSLERDDTGETQAVELVLHGRFKSIDSGTWKPADVNTTKVSCTNTYAKLTIGGEVVYEVDVLNMIEKVAGVDRLAAHRKAIGL